MIIGVWYSAVYLSFWLTVALIPINNRFVYEGDTGTLLMHLWFALPLALMAAIAAVVLVAVSDVRGKGIPGNVLVAFVYPSCLREESCSS